jgi:sigma-B regulation protein RsbU (phosphoserine phosphatase)
MGQFRNFEVAVFRRIHRDPPTGFVHHTAFWLFVAYFFLALLGWLPGDTGIGFHDFATLDFYVLICFCIPLLWRYVFGRLLWKVRNRLIVTYVLMGLTPVVLFVTLAALLLYVFSGQFAIFAATSVINDELAHIAAQNNSFAMHIAHTLDHDPGIRGLSLPEAGDDPSEHEYSGLTIAAFHDGKFIGLLPSSVEAHDIPAVPGWLPATFSGIVLDHGRLWLRAVDTQPLNGHTTVAITSVPIEKENVEAIARNLGRVSIYTGVRFGQTQGSAPQKTNFQFNTTRPDQDDANVKIGDESLAEARKHAIVASTRPALLRCARRVSRAASH